MSKPLILLVDDDIDALNLFGLLLEHHQFEVLKAKDGRGALAILERVTPDVIITDDLMPDMGGVDLCKKISTTPETSNIPVALWSAGQALHLGMDELNQAGVRDIILKPTHPNRMIEQIRSLLEMYPHSSTGRGEAADPPE